MIGLTLIPVAITKIGGGDAAAASFGAPDNLLLGFVTIALIIGIQILPKDFFVRLLF